MTAFSNGFGAEYTVAIEVFKRVARTVWFRNDARQLNRLAEAVLDAYRSGITDPEELYEHSTLLASMIRPAAVE